MQISETTQITKYFLGVSFLELNVTELFSF